MMKVNTTEGVTGVVDVGVAGAVAAVCVAVNLKVVPGRGYGSRLGRSIG